MSLIVVDCCRREKGGYLVVQKNRYESINRGSMLDVMNYSFTVTQNCNLACKYCYEKKNNDSRMSIKVAKDAVDFALRYGQHTNRARFDFMGGEPLLEINMIDELMDYIKFKLYEENHRWFGNCSFDLTTNGVLYGSDDVQRFVKKNLNCLNISMTIDGTKEKHDMNRIFRNGEGSFESVLKNVPLWLEQFPTAGTKVTFASADLKYLKDSLIFLNSLGIQEIMATLVNEDVWSDGDEVIYERQLCELADYMVENDCPTDFAGGQFSENIGLPYTKNRLKVNWCNCGENNFEIDFKGNLYPCVRFLPFTLSKNERIIGNIYEGVNINKLRPFEVLNFVNQSTEECLKCPVANGCGWCVGNNYNNDVGNTIFSRSTAICKMHKARARANDYYWAKLRTNKGIVRKNIPNLDRKRFQYIMLSDDSVGYCFEMEKKRKSSAMSIDTFRAALRFARMNFYTPVILYDERELDQNFEKELLQYEVMRIKPISRISKGDDAIAVMGIEDISKVDVNKLMIQVILHISQKDLNILSESCSEIFKGSRKIHLILDDWYCMNEKSYMIYKSELEKISEIIVSYAKNKKYRQINVLTDIMISSDKMNCGAGYSSMLVAPNGELYPCSGFYYSDSYDKIGDVNSGIIKDSNKYNMSDAPICSRCDISNCNICVLNNIQETKEYRVPSIEQCSIKNMEKTISVELQKRLLELDPSTPFGRNILKESEYVEAIDSIITEKYMQYR